MSDKPINDKGPQDKKEDLSLFERFLQLFWGEEKPIEKAEGEVPPEGSSAPEIKVATTQSLPEAKQAMESIALKEQQPPEEETKQLTLEEIEKLAAAAAGGEASDGGFGELVYLAGGSSGIVESVPRDLGLGGLNLSLPEQVLFILNPEPPGVESTPPDANNDGFGGAPDTFPVFESGLPHGSDLDPRHPNPPAQPAAIMVVGNVLANDVLGTPAASISKISFAGQDFLPGAGGVISATSPLGVLLVYTQDGNGHLAGDFQYTLIIDTDHPLGSGKNEVNETFTYTLSNPGGSDSADLLIRIVDDLPIAVDDGVKSVQEGKIPITGNLLVNDVPGADNPIKVIGFSYDGGTHTALIPLGGSVTVQTSLGGVLTVSSNGNWEYFSPMSVDNTKDPVHDDITYTITDSDEDPSSAKLGLIITDGPPPDPKDDGVGPAPDEFLVFESGLQGGSDTDPNNPNPPAQPRPTQVSGNVLTNDTFGSDPASITKIVYNNVTFMPVNGIISIPTPDGMLVLYTQPDNSGHNAGDFTFTLTSVDDHAPGQGNNQFLQNFTYTLADSDGDSGDADLIIRVVDDVPQAINDGTKVVQEGHNSASGNVMSNDVKGADVPVNLTSFSYNNGANVAQVTLGGSTTVTTMVGGTLTVGSDGKWSYISPTSVDNSKGNVPDGFSYTIIDDDGDPSSASQPILISDGPPPDPKDDGVGPAPDEFIVYESGLPGGSDTDPRNPNAPAQPKPTEVSGNVLANDTFGSDPAGITQIVYNNTTYTAVNGVITIPTDNGSLTLYTQNVGGHQAGDFTFDLTSKDNHPLGQGNNQLFEQFTYTLADNDGDSGTANLIIRVVDDVPTAINDAFSIIKPPLPSYNLVFTLDVSGSMGEIIAGTGGKSRLDILQEAMTNNGALLDSYENASSALHITIVTFSNGSQTSASFTDVDAVKSYVNGLTAGGTTNYLSAINSTTAVINADDANPNLATYVDRVYFMSDGMPNPTSTALNATQIQNWQNLLNSNDINSIVLNIAPPGNNLDQYLNPLANPGDTPLVYHVNADLSNLQGILIGTIGDVASVDGNIVTNDVPGADSPINVTHISFTFANAQSASQYLAAHPELSGASASGNTVSIPIPNGVITTPLGQKLELASNGDFTYTINSQAQDGVIEKIGYTIIDQDGDPSSAQFQFVINTAPDTHDDGFGTGNDAYLVHESGLPAGSDLDPNNPNPPAQPAAKVVGGNILANDSLGTGALITKVTFNNADHTAVNGVITINTGLGILLVYTQTGNGHNAGDFQYTLSHEVDHAPGQGNNNFNELFTYTVTNNTNLSDSSDLLIRVVDDVPKAINDLAKTIQEGQLSTSGNVMANDVKGADTPVNLSSFTYNNGASSANVATGGFTTVTTAQGGILKVFSNGDWTYVSPASVDNKNGNVQDGFNYTIRDNDGDTSSATQGIAISDGVPLAVNDNLSIVKPPLPDYNLVFTLDISGSMGEIVSGGKSRLDVTKEALTNNGALLDSYEAASSNLHITIVTFSSGSQTSQAFTNVDAAKAYIDNLDAGGTTNYRAAINSTKAVMSADNANASLDGYIDKVYFMSDGEPNPVSSAMTAAETQSWQNLLNSTDFDSIVLNIAPPSNQGSVDQYLEPLANPGDNPDVYHINANLSNLQGILIGTIGDVAHINGNLLSNDISGPDAPIKVTDIQFTFANSTAANQYLSSHGGLGASVSGNTVTIPIPNGSIDTPTGQTLVVNANGTFTYTIGADAVEGSTESFKYTIIDNDGDKSTATASIDIDGSGSMMMMSFRSSFMDSGASLSNDAASGKGTSVSGNVLANDSLPPDASISRITFNGSDYFGVGGIISIQTMIGTLLLFCENVNGHAAGDFEYTLNKPADGLGSLGESFTYHVSHSGGEDSAELTVSVVDDMPKSMDAASSSAPDASAMSVQNDSGDAPRVTSFSYDGGSHNAMIPDGSSTTVSTEHGGLLTVASDGTWKYVPPEIVDDGAPKDQASAHSGNTDHDMSGSDPDANSASSFHDDFTYTMSDKDGDSSATQYILVTAESSNDDGHDLTAKDGIVSEISFHTDNAMQYIHDHNLSDLKAMIGSDGKSVHILLPNDGSEIEFTTPSGASLAINNKGEYSYTALVDKQGDGESFDCLFKDAGDRYFQGKLDINAMNHPDSLLNLMGNQLSDDDHRGTVTVQGDTSDGGYIVDASEINRPESIPMKDLGMSGNVLNYLNIGSAGNDAASHDALVDLGDAASHHESSQANYAASAVPSQEGQAIDHHLDQASIDSQVQK